MLEQYLTEDFILEHQYVDKDDLLGINDWCLNLTWQEIRRQVNEVLENWDDIRDDLIQALLEMENPLGYRGLSVSDFI